MVVKILNSPVLVSWLVSATLSGWLWLTHSVITNIVYHPSATTPRVVRELRENVCENLTLPRKGRESHMITVLQWKIPRTINCLIITSKINKSTSYFCLTKIVFLFIKRSSNDMHTYSTYTNVPVHTE